MCNVMNISFLSIMNYEASYIFYKDKTELMRQNNVVYLNK